MRTRPNILVTGTPGTGKTTLASLVGDEDGFVHIAVPSIVKEHSCYDGYDNSLDTNILDEDKLLDVLESQFEDEEERGRSIVVDFHMCEIFPERWFDLIIVLRTNTEELFDRLTARGYSERKRQDNMECEIMQVILESARESYDKAIVHEMPSNSMEDLESAKNRIIDWSRQWISDRSSDNN